MIDADIIARAQHWQTHDPDPQTRSELATLIEARSDELIDRFSGPLVFGTAGLRGILGAGESRMNRAVIRRTAVGLARYLLEHEPDAAQQGVVIGYDGRHLSHELAYDTASVLCAAGLKVHLWRALCPTPLVAFAVKSLSAAAGVMVTASHNPPQYNGFKVYARNGAQIIPPADALIAARIDAAEPADQVAMMPHTEAVQSGRLSWLEEPLKAQYLTALRQLDTDPRASEQRRSMCIVYTPLHGVGNELFHLAMGQAGFENLHTVAEQEQPDGAFPTVAFPNPEEPGCLDLALALAEEKSARLLIANDPDADRLAAVVRDRDDKLVQLTGNEVGGLLGHHLLENAKSTGPQASQPLLVTTVVSSPLLGVISRAYGAAFEETLTGFKWIANQAMRREQQGGCTFLFGYEEALGYCVGDTVRDKDGISAALVLAIYAAQLHAQGESLLDALERISRRFGLFVSAQHSMQFPGVEGREQMAAAMSQLRSAAPSALAGRNIVAVADCLESTRTEQGQTTEITLPKSNVLVFELEGGHRVIARPSGTEPKMKIYFDVRVQLKEGDSVGSGKARAGEIITELQAATLALLGLSPPSK